MKTRVLCSSIFFMAVSVLRGNLRMLWADKRGVEGMDFLGYLGFLARRRVLGRRKEVVVRIFLVLVPLVPLRAALRAA